MDLHPGNASRFELAIEGLDRDLRVLRLEGEEALSRPFLFRLDLACEDHCLDFAQAIDRPATLTLFGQDGIRHVNSIVHAFGQGEPGQRFCLYQAELVPTIWRLGHRRNCRIFQQQGVPEIVARILAEAGLGADRYRQVLHGTHPTLEYCVQYRESDLDFISRLMEQEGIYYYFEHDETSHVLVMTDTPRGPSRGRGRRHSALPPAQCRSRHWRAPLRLPLPRAPASRRCRTEGL